MTDFYSIEYFFLFYTIFGGWNAILVF